MVAAKFDSETGFTSLLRFGALRTETRLDVLKGLPIATVADSNGYDGQFYAQIAVDPSLSSPELSQVLDAPSYRARRILAPAAAAAIGLGRPWWILQAYALLNVLAWFVFAWLLWSEIGTTTWISFARWSACLFSLGTLDSVRQSLVDLPALVLLMLAVRAHSRKAQAPTTAWTALGSLTKETNLLGAMALQLDVLGGKTTRPRAMFVLTLGALPLAIWSMYVGQRFGDTFATYSLGNFSWPLAGLTAHLQYSVAQLWTGNYDSRHTFGLLGPISLGLQLVVLWRNPGLSLPWWRIGAAYSILMLFLSAWVWSGYWAACRAVLPMTIAFNLLLQSGRWFWSLWCLGNITLLHGVWRFL